MCKFHSPFRLNIRHSLGPHLLTGVGGGSTGLFHGHWLVVEATLGSNTILKF